MDTTGDNDFTSGPRPGAPEAWSAADEWPAGWYADPWQSGRERRWTGSAWTADTRGATGPTIAGLGGSPPSSPSGPPPEPAPPPPTETSSTTGSPARRVVAIALTLALIAAVIGFAVTYVAADTSNNTTSPTVPPARGPSPTQPPSSNPSPSLGSIPRNQTPPSSGGANTPGPQSPSGTTVDPSASVLQQLVVRQADVKRPNSVVLSDGGAGVASAPTLDLCNGTYPSESMRTARLQVDEITSSGAAALSTEAVLYRNADATAQAFSELRSVVAHCPATPVPSPVGEPTVAMKFNAAPDSSWANVPGVTRQAYDFTATNESGASTRGVAVYLRRGRALVGLYFATPPGAAQSPVAGKTTIPAIVNVFAQRLASVPASEVGG